jgi:SAM-dependent methyltransferase
LHASIGETFRRVRLGSPERILDVGCGTGLLFDRLSEALPDAGLFGVDPSAGMLGVARGKAGGRAALTRAAAERLPFRSGSFDLVLTVSALHYWREPAAGVREIRRVLRPGGQVAITGWCLDYLTTRAIVGWLRLTGRPLGQVLGAAAQARLLEEAGFAEVVVERYRIGLVWGMMTATARKPQ